MRVERVNKARKMPGQAELESMLKRSWSVEACKEMSLSDYSVEAQTLTYFVTSNGQASDQQQVRVVGDSIIRMYSPNGLITFATNPDRAADAFGYPNGDHGASREPPYPNSQTQWLWSHCPYIVIAGTAFTTPSGDHGVGVLSSPDEPLQWDVAVNDSGQVFVYYNDDKYDDNSGQIQFTLEVTSPANLAVRLLKRST